MYQHLPGFTKEPLVSEMVQDSFTLKDAFLIGHTVR